MPVYEYRCTSCERVTELSLKLAELDQDVQCEICQGLMKRSIGNNGGFVLKGDCWSRDGYARYYGDIK